MRFTALICVLACAGALWAQAGSEDSAVLRARAGIEKLRVLVDAGAAPRAELERAEEALADAQDYDFLRRTLYGPELSEEQADAMIAAATRRMERRQKELENARKLVDEGVASQLTLGTFLEELDRARKEFDLAESRARLTRDLAQMARLEENLQRSMEQSPDAARDLADHFEGAGVFTAEELRKVERAYEMRFAKPLPVSAMGDTAVHRALGFDHRGRVDVAVTPDQPEGVWLRQYLEANRIPYFAFRQAVPGKATGAHIHIGPMSGRILHGG